MGHSFDVRKVKYSVMGFNGIIDLAGEHQNFYRQSAQRSYIVYRLSYIAALVNG